MEDWARLRAESQGPSRNLGLWFQSRRFTPMAQVLPAFCIGVLLSPWGSGAFFLAVVAVIYDLFFYIFSWRPDGTSSWDMWARGGAFLASILGWVIGRTASGQELFPAGVPDPRVFWDSL